MDEEQKPAPKKLTRQRAWQIRKKAEGRCTTCGAIRDGKSADYCEKCKGRHLRLKRKRAEKAKALANAEPVSYMRYDPEAT